MLERTSYCFSNCALMCIVESDMLLIARSVGSSNSKLRSFGESGDKILDNSK